MAFCCQKCLFLIEMPHIKCRCRSLGVVCFDWQSPTLFTVFASEVQDALPRQAVLTEKPTAGCEGLRTVSQSFRVHLSPPADL